MKIIMNGNFELQKNNVNFILKYSNLFEYLSICKEKKLSFAEFYPSFNLQIGCIDCNDFGDVFIYFYDSLTQESQCSLYTSIKELKKLVKSEILGE